MTEPMLGVDISIVKTAAQGPEWPLGTEYTDGRTGKRYRYINADTAIVNGDALTPTLTDADVPFSLVPAAAVALPIFGMGIVSIAAEGFGWVQTHGKKLDAKVADAVTIGQFLGTTATAGQLDFITYTTTAATLAQLLALHAAVLGIRVWSLTAGSASNLGDVWLE